MRTVDEIYAAYRIMPGLMLHQLRVAAVAKAVCDSMSKEVNARDILLTCLFHDMGNIIKSDLVTFPEFLEPLGASYWRGVKEDFIRAYGTDEHRATHEIAKEIGLPEAVLGYIERIGFSKLSATRDSDSYEQKISEYSDCRVGPYGVFSMRERFEEAKKRYAKRNSEMPRDKRAFETQVEAAYEIERQIFSHASIRPEDITEDSIQHTVHELRSYPV